MSRDRTPITDEMELGETETFESKMEMGFWGTGLADRVVGYEADVTDLRVTDARVVGEEGNEEIKLAVAGEVAKVEPREWTTKEVEEEQDKRNPVSVPTWLPTLITSAVIITVSLAVMSAMPTFEIVAASHANAHNPTLGKLAFDTALILGALALATWTVKHVPYHGGSR